MTAKYGTPYFSNYINSDMSQSDVRAMCLYPLTYVRILYNGHPCVCTMEYLYDYLDVNEVLVQTRYGYRPIKEKQRFGYEGYLYKFITESGNIILSTPDHPHVVFDGSVTRKPVMKKVPAMNVKVGDSFSGRPNTADALRAIAEARKGKTYEEIYGPEIAAQLKQQKAEWCKANGVFVGENNPAYGGLSDEWRMHISMSEQGHYVSEACRQASSQRWAGQNNPYYSEYGSGTSGGFTYTVSKYEQPFADELDALGIQYTRQMAIKDTGVVDFYIPSKNLVVELETDYRFDTCAYNDTSRIFIKNLKEKYDKILEAGFNLLIFNPAKDDSSYRPYINKKDMIVAIEMVPYSGYVYDLEVYCDDLDPTRYNIDMAHTFYANDILTGNCCRLRLDLRELRRKAGGYFGSGESTGSIGVVTLNLPRMSYISNSEEEFFQNIDKYMDIAARSLDIKRRVVNRMLENGLYPYTKRYLGSYYNYFSTIGLVGMNEAIVNAKWIPNTNIASEEGKEFAKKVLNHMRDRLSDYQEKYENTLFNLEATPAESTTYRFAKHDVADFPDIITAADPGCAPFYTNSSHLPVGYTADVFEALDNQDELQTLYTSGTVFHAFLGERLPDWRAAMKLVRTIAENYRLPYYTLSPTYSICRNHGYISGDVAKCPKCGCETETYSRITGYYRPIKNWNDGKAQEFKQRKTYTSAASSFHFSEKSMTNVTGNVNANEEECEACKIDYDTLATSTVSASTSDFPASTLSDPPAMITTTTSNHLVMITTTTCPNCKLAKEKLNKFGFKYDEVYADKDPEFAKKYNVRQAPTLLILNDSHEEIERYTSLGNISRYVKEHI